MKTIISKVLIPTDRQFHIAVPEALPDKVMTAGNLLQSPVFGVWKTRTDIEDSRDSAREPRATAGAMRPLGKTLT